MAPRGGQQRDELGRFVAGAGEAADKLGALGRAIDDSTKATQESARSKKEEAEAQKILTGRLNTGLGVAGNALSAVATTGDFEAGLASATRAGINAVRGLEVQGVRVGEFAAEVSGLNRADRVLGSAADRTLDVTGDLARYGIDVSNDFRKGLLDTAIEQEKRVEDERAKVSGAAYSPGNVAGLVGEQGARLIGLVERLLSAVEGFGGGSGN